MTKAILRAAALVVGLAATGVASAALNVQLLVVERDGENRTMQPVTSGVPLPEGMFQDVSKLRLVDEAGNEVPCQMTPTVRWWRDKSIRWVLLDFQASVPAFAMRPFVLRDDGPAKAIQDPIAVEESPERIVVTTGPFRFAVRRRGFSLIDEAWLDESGQGRFDDAHRIVKSSEMNGPVIWSNFPNLPVYRRYLASKDRESQVTVEEAGPMRAVIKAVGRHLAEDAKDSADKCLDYTIRLHAYRGLGLVRVQYSAECKQGEHVSRFTPLDRWHVGLAADLGKDLTYAFGNEGAPVKGTFGGQDRAWLVCESADDWEAGGAAYHHADSGRLRGRAMSIQPQRLGAVTLAGADQAVTVCLQNFWQNYPKGLFVHPDGAVQVALWPSFVRKTPTWTGYTGDRKANFFPGISKTHDLVFFFHGTKGPDGKPLPDRLPEINAFANRPLFARCRPEWYCQETRAFGRVASSNPDLYPDDVRWVVENYDHFFEMNRRAQLNARNYVRGIDAYGMFNFGDAVNHITSERRDNVGERPDPTDIHWDNLYYRYAHGMIIQFARTGNLDLLEIGDEASKHLQDVDTHCWHPDPRFVGSPQYSAGPDHVRNYGSGDPVYASDTYNHYKNQSLFERYWLLGDRRALEMGILSANFARLHKTNALSQSRSIGHGIIGLLVAYETTLDASYLDAARVIVEKTRAFRKSESGAWIDGIALEGHKMWYEITGDAKAVETVLGGVDAAMTRKDLAGAILDSVGFAYSWTGDRKYRDLLVQGLVRNARGRSTIQMNFGNHFHSTGYAFWYLTKDQPKKIEAPLLLR
jgi:hypothetical protein